MDRIVQFLREFGSEGQLVFRNKKLVNILHYDEQQQQQQQQQLGIKNETKLGFIKPLLGEEEVPNKYKRILVQAATGIIDQNLGLLSKQLLKQIPGLQESQQNVSRSLQYANQTHYKIKTNFQGIRYQANSQKNLELKELNSVINMLSHQYSKQRQEVMDDLQDVDGNIQNLILVYQDPAGKGYLKWSEEDDRILEMATGKEDRAFRLLVRYRGCLLYTSDAADEEDSVDLGGLRIIKKKRQNKYTDEDQKQIRCQDTRS
eukprot:TRINITY_DN8170_c0_g1_i7.p1 TRINITY_DN8170_c0_g1~~TRINITY_DN8170_c0_g1_i7.p1  ORF type:complete len:260 (-),score=38.13 TRINITY_DN8170_c0_g1_i7:11-790(-)